MLRKQPSSFSRLSSAKSRKHEKVKPFEGDKGADDLKVTIESHAAKKKLLHEVIKALKSEKAVRAIREDHGSLGSA